MVMRSIKSCGQKKQSEAYFAWRLTNWCNYKCSYCPNLRIITDNYQHDDHATYHKLVTTRLRTVEMPFTVCLTGGEPTLYPGIYDVVKDLAGIDNCQNAVLMTNLSRPASFYEKFGLIGSSKVVVMASAHPEYVKADQFIEKSMLLAKMSPMRYTAHVCLVDDPNTWDTSERIITTLIDAGVNVKPNMLFETVDSKQDYTPEFYTRFLKYFEQESDSLIHEIECVFDDGTTGVLKDYEFEIEGLNRFKGYRCKTAAFKIMMDGTISNSCTGRALPLLLNDKNLVHEELCPKDVCDGRQLLTYHKYRHEV